MSAASPRHVASLDGWRGMAILLVLASHFGGIAPIGRLGVDMFFTLSGLLMSRILFVDRMPIGTFYQRRVARLFPAFYLFLAVTALAASLYDRPFPAKDFAFTALSLSAYFTDTESLPFGHLWSLNIEEHCYVFLSLVAVLARASSNPERFARRAILAATLVCVGFFICYKLHPPASLPIEKRTECSGFSILISCVVFLELRRRPLPALRWLPVACGGAGIILSACLTHGPLKFLLAPALLAVSVNTLGLAPGWLPRFLSRRALAWFGVCSYSLYVWQQPFYWLGKYHLWPYGNGVGFVCAMATGICSFYGFEQPVRKWLRSPDLRRSA